MGALLLPLHYPHPAPALVPEPAHFSCHHCHCCHCPPAQPADGGGSGDLSKTQRQDLHSKNVHKALVNLAPWPISGPPPPPGLRNLQESSVFCQEPYPFLPLGLASTLLVICSARPFLRSRVRDLHLQALGLARRPLSTTATSRSGPVEPPLWFPTLHCARGMAGREGPS